MHALHLPFGIVVVTLKSAVAFSPATIGHGVERVLRLDNEELFPVKIP